MRLIYGIGIQNVDLAKTAEMLKVQLGVPLRLRENDNYGGDFYYGQMPGAEVFLHRNVEVPENEPIEEGWPKEALLLVISSSEKGTHERYRSLVEGRPDLAQIELIREDQWFRSSN